MPGFLQRLGLATKVLTGTLNEQQILNLLFPGLRGTPPPRGTLEMLKAYSEMPWLRATVHKVAGSCAQAAWHAYAVRRTGADGRKAFVKINGLARCGTWASRHKEFQALRRAGELVELDTHPVLDLLHRPNSYFTGYVHRKLTQIYVELVGEAPWMYERNGLGAPSGVWALPPNWIRNLPNPAQPYYVVQGYGAVAEVPPTEILLFKDPDPWNPFGRGAGTGKAIADELETDAYSAKYTKQFFYNNARPDFIAIVDGASKAELARAEQRWLERFQGFWRSWRPYFTNTKFTLQQIEQDNFRQMQLTELRKFERDTIVQVFGLPPELLGIIENSNRATIDSADYLFATHVLEPRLEFQREILQERLVPLYDDRLILEYDTPVKEDRAFELEARSAMPATVEVDAWRDIQGLPPLGEEGGGKLYVFSNLMIGSESPGGGAIEDKPPPPAPVIAPPPKPPADGGKRLRRGAALRALGSGRAVLLLGTTIQAFVAGQKLNEQGFAELIHQLADALAPAWRQAFLRAVAEARARVDPAELERAVAAGDAARVVRLLGVDQFVADLAATVPPLVAGTAGAAGDAAAATLGDALGVELTFNHTNPAVTAWVQQHAGELITQVSETSRLAVREIIDAAFHLAIAPADQARLIAQVVGLDARRAAAVAAFRAQLAASEAANLEARTAKYAAAQLRDRATAIARTETIAGANQGQNLLWQQALQDGQLSRDRSTRVWIVTDDDRLCAEICEPMDGQEVGMDEPFVTGEGDAVDTPPTHPLCRCAIGLKITREA